MAKESHKLTQVFNLRLSATPSGQGLTLLSPNSDKHETSPYLLLIYQNIQVTRIKEMITKDQMSRFFNQILPTRTIRNIRRIVTIILILVVLDTPKVCKD